MILRRISAYLRNVLGERSTTYIQNSIKARIKRLDLKKKDSVLDIGCGYSYPATFLLVAMGYSTSGVDIVNYFWRDGLKCFVKNRIKNLGILRGIIEGLVVYMQEYKRYGKLLHLTNSDYIDHATLNLSSYDGVTLPCSNESFSIAVSQDVLEHVMDLDVFWSEVNRVLKPSGKVDMIYHNFYSPSGAHAPVNPANPWVHVLKAANINTHSSLNQKHPYEIVDSAVKNGIKITNLIPVDFDGNVHPQSTLDLEGASYLPRWEQEVLNKVSVRFSNLKKPDGILEITHRQLITTTRWLLCGYKISK